MLTLAIGGALFIVAMNLGASIDVTVDNAFDTRQISDIVIFADYYPTENISRNLASTPGIARAECMANTMAFLTNADGTESNQFTVLAIPPELGMINYPIIEGRWLQPGDENAVVPPARSLRIRHEKQKRYAQNRPTLRNRKTPKRSER